MTRLNNAREADPIIRAVAPWYGSKRGMDPDIVTQLGPHRVYWEPFCGSMAVLLAKPECSAETVNDLHGDLINLARVIQHPRKGPALYRRLRRSWIAEDGFEKSKLRIASEPCPSFTDADRAFDFFVIGWLGRNGTIGSRNTNTHFCVRYSPNGGSAAARWRGAVDSLPRWRQRMRNITILNRCGLEICERIIDVPGTAIYVDPPYLQKSEPYKHDFADGDHARLVVSYYAHPRLAELYPSWTILDCTRVKQIAQANKRGKNGKTEAPEVLLLNGPAFADDGPTLF